jgi:hypothetical protein
MLNRWKKIFKILKYIPLKNKKVPRTTENMVVSFPTKKIQLRLKDCQSNNVKEDQEVKNKKKECYLNCLIIGK